MRELFKPFFTWFLGLFNVGLYRLSDNIDSLILYLYQSGLENQANELVHLYKLVEYQQGVLIILDTFKCFFMLLSLLLLFAANQEAVIRFFYWIYSKSRSFFHFMKALFNRFQNKFKTPKS